MGDNQNWGNTGEQIKSALTEALQSGDFRNLNALMSQTATSVLDEVGIHITRSGGDKGGSGFFGPGRGTQPGAGPAAQPWQQAKRPQAQQTWRRPEGMPSGTEQQPGTGQPWQSGTGQTAQPWQQSGAARERQSGQPWQQPGAGGAGQPWQPSGAARGWQSGQSWQAAQPGAGQQQVAQALQQAKMQARQTWEQAKTQAVQTWRQAKTQSGAGLEAQPWQQEMPQEAPGFRRSANLSFVNMKKVGNVSNVLYQVFGGIGLGFTGFVTFVRLLAFASGDTTLAGWIVNFIFLAVFFGMIRLGIGQKRRLKRARRYVSLCDCRMFGEVAYLAKNTGKSEEYVAKDIQKMLDIGIFPEGHLDDQKTCFMLNDIVYRQYLEAEDGRRRREKLETEPQEQGKTTQDRGVQDEEAGMQESELNTMVAEGMECIRRLRDLNDRISGDGISARLFCLENLLKDIFDSIREHPEQMHRMHKLMDYYLPTTLKLVEAYAEFDQVSAPGEEIIEAKAEIENTLDIINQAFTELLNNLFQDAVFDATTDAQVLKTMLAREGLTREMEFATISRER